MTATIPAAALVLRLMRSPRSAKIHPLACTLLLVLLFLGGAGCALLRGARPQAPPLITESVPPTPLVLPEDSGRFVGSAACVSCHQEEAADHSNSVHSHSVYASDHPQALAPFRTDQKLFDRVLEVTYTFTVKDGKPVARVHRKNGQVVEMTPAYLVGSGKYGLTPVYERNGIFMEGRASYYPPMKKWDWTPGQETETFGRQAEGRVLDTDEAMNCFLCHGTVLVKDGLQALAAGTRLDVGCERCHGPGKEHVEAAEAGQGGRALYAYKTASASTIMNLCAQCHRRPSSGGAVDLASDRNLPRFAGTALGASKCYTRSQGKLSCVTCHNPHKPVSEDAGHYERICLDCHSGASKTEQACPVNPKGGCVPCHMPRQPIDMPGGAKFHNHWIKVYKDLETASAR